MGSRVAHRVKRYAVDSRVVLKLRCDLTVPSHRLRPKDNRPGFRLLPFDEDTAQRLIVMLAAVEPRRVKTIEHRRDTRVQGCVAEENGEVLGYTFYTTGKHPDLDWLGMTVSPGEIFGFDYFVRPTARGIGAHFARSTQEAQFNLGFKAAYGHVYADNTAALWTYRITGWTEIGRVTEHRVLNRFTAVNGVLYEITLNGRERIGTVPGLHPG